MSDIEANAPGKQESRSDLSLGRERTRIRLMKFGLTLLGALLLLSLIITLIINQ